MKDDLHLPQGPPEQAEPSGPVIAVAQNCARLFQSTDWLSFGFTTVAALVVYLFTLAPEVTLERNGIFATGAFYAGVPHPPGYPLWTIYAWLFTALLPVSNIAWRVGVSSAVAGALTCGVLALMVSRGGSLLLDGIPGLDRLPRKQGKLLRVMSGYVAGMAFGFSSAFWSQAVVADVWTLSMLLLSLVLCLLFRWVQDTERRRYPITACFVYGLTLTNSQALALAAPGLAVVVLLASPPLGRDGLAAITMLLAAGIAAHFLGILPETVAAVVQVDLLGRVYFWGGIVTFLVSAGLVLNTRRLFTEWKTVLASSCSLVLGLSLYLYLPIASMTNPPVNWGYPRTVTGFSHVLTRGQFERIHPTDSFRRFIGQIWIYVETAVTHFGRIYLLAALIPILFIRKIRVRDRRWLLGTFTLYICLSLIMVAFLNPAPDRQSVELFASFYSASYLMLALWAGYGLMLAGVILARRSPAASH